MIKGIRLKICGLTNLSDAEAADHIGADYLGFILWPKSLRAVTLNQFAAMHRLLPDRRKVAVLVEPDPATLPGMVAAGFDTFQIHFRPEVAATMVPTWSALIGADRLWLAPKLPPEGEFDERWLEYAQTFLMDTFHAAGFGGSGLTGDWHKFRCRGTAAPNHNWILAGGLNPTNIVDAIEASGTRWIDVNSGVESAPGVKDIGKLAELSAALRAR